MAFAGYRLSNFWRVKRSSWAVAILRPSSTRRLRCRDRRPKCRVCASLSPGASRPLASDHDEQSAVPAAGQKHLQLGCRAHGEGARACGSNSRVFLVRGLLSVAGTDDKKSTLDASNHPRTSSIECRVSWGWSYCSRNHACQRPSFMPCAAVPQNPPGRPQYDGEHRCRWPRRCCRHGKACGTDSSAKTRRWRSGTARERRWPAAGS